MNTSESMNLPETSIQLWHNLFELKSRDLIIEKVFQQLSNDFSLTGNSLPITANHPTENWSHQLVIWLENQPSASIQQLLYTIDLPENFVHNLNDATHYHEQLAEAIIYRELVKVYYKITYSS